VAEYMAAGALLDVQAESIVIYESSENQASWEAG
jgi:hypothetical protein